MKTLLIKYWVQFVFLIVASLLIFILIPNQEKSYLVSDVDVIRKKSRLILIITILVLLGIILISAIKHPSTLKQFLNFSLSLLFLGLGFFFVLSPVFLFGTFALNKLSTRKLVENKYWVVYTDDNYMQLKNIQSGEMDRVEQIVQENEKYIINQHDTITLIFKKGLFGYKFDPTHRGNGVYPQ